MRVGVFPKVGDDLRAALSAEMPTKEQKRLIEKSLFDLVGHGVELRGRLIGTICRTDIRWAPYRGEEKPSCRIYATVIVEHDQQEYVRRFLPGGDNAVARNDEVTNLVGVPAPDSPAPAAETPT